MISIADAIAILKEIPSFWRKIKMFMSKRINPVQHIEISLSSVPEPITIYSSSNSKSDLHIAFGISNHTSEDLIIKDITAVINIADIKIELPWRTPVEVPCHSTKNYNVIKGTCTSGEYADIKKKFDSKKSEPTDNQGRLKCTVDFVGYFKDLKIEKKELEFLSPRILNINSPKNT